ncbi:hypothetical protein C5Y96_10920 [Blastopirellula marina]|uniref:3-keto-alpha-glucoside-1,2-lyase/3-keto-2-hydroxy-glucal hydratase domain-containing protein n=1 Tax=Blastopirellula marina TaxID=124 RepID=A0A2S8FMF7_9BACT|nr:MULTISPECIES: family 16 glycoside hydrolase [Pirellulaceae]PQO33356.1 hypothetical protein C5Y96_10920 [Blastopirellula marina]RCS52445.1 DUF1080 domain-containing protein [Bremerella cremea]
MIRSTAFALGLSTVLLALTAMAEEASSPLDTLMCERGKLLLSDSFETGPSKQWRTAKGKWEAVDGATQGSELKADEHVAAMRVNQKVRNLVLQYSFKMDGSKTTTLSINDAKGHNSRVMINANGFSVRKDDHDHAGPDKAELLQMVKTKIAPGKWHTLVVEFNGPEMLARLDGKQVAYGSHEAIDVDKTNFGLTVGGESVSFKDFSLWEATPKADWSQSKAKVISQSK